MASFMISVLLLAGASDSSGLSLQAQLGYEPAVLIRGDDYRRSVIGGGLPNLDGMFYSSHSLIGKIGVQTEKGWEWRLIGSITRSIIPNGSSNLKLPPDSLGEEWYSSYTRWTSIEYGIGPEIGHSLMFQWGEGSIYLGLEGVYGKLLGTDSLFKWNSTIHQYDIQVIHVTSPILGAKVHLGLGVPIVNFRRFSLQIHSILKGGAVYERSTDIPPEAEWKGPYTLSKFGVALGLTLNYNRGEKK